MKARNSAGDQERNSHCLILRFIINKAQKSTQCLMTDKSMA